jgi:hypothetical protein
MFTPIFGRVKGETELLLAEMQKANPRFRVESVRPAFIDYGDHKSIHPYLHQTASKQAWNTATGPIFRSAFRRFCSPTEPLGKFLAECAMGKWDGQYKGPGFETVGDSGFTIVHNNGFRALAGLDK